MKETIHRVPKQAIYSASRVPLINVRPQGAGIFPARAKTGNKDILETLNKLIYIKIRQCILATDSAIKLDCRQANMG